MATSEWEAWPKLDPPRGFPERLGARLVEVERHRTRRRRRRVWAAGATILAVAAACFVWGAPVSRGDVTAVERREIHLGARDRAVAVLEHAAHVSWAADDVTQDAGDVFYRVERGQGFVVHTPAGDVCVKGTCFRVALSGDARNAVVSVLEGKVVVARGPLSLDLHAGERATLDQTGVHAAGGVVGTDTTTANRGLVHADSGSAERARLVALEAEKQDIEQRLREAEQALAAHSASPLSPASEWDLGPDDWKKLAAEGVVKYQLPCRLPDAVGGSTNPFEGLALSPDDTSTLRGAYQRSNARVWTVVRDLCADATGSVDAAERLGTYTCTHVVLVQATERDRASVNDAMKKVAEIRAGERPMPALGAEDAVVRLFLAVTGEMAEFEGDLAQSLGPREAHRVAYAEGACVSRDMWGPHM